jgi:glutamate/tyrosine decarboxylase-like PLP-dependent enzyme
MPLEPEITDRLARAARELEPLAQLWREKTVLPAEQRRAVDELVARLVDNYPYGDVKYIGQILKPPHPVAWIAYAVAALVNPNNHALDAGPATSVMEKEAVKELAGMFGLSEHLGHLTSSGTIANLEALYVARELNPAGVVVSSKAAHYTHARMSHLLGRSHESIKEDHAGRMDMDALERRLEAGGVGTVVATLGTTSLGALDPVHDIVPLAKRFGARVHVDAAYGGFHTLLSGEEPLVDPRPFKALADVDSIVVDPHKHGLQPYGCGSVLFSDPKVGRFFAHDSPYTYFTSDQLHLGEISIECSRAGASAAAFWTTLKALGLSRNGGLGEILADGKHAAQRIAQRIRSSDAARLVVDPELDIVCFYANAPTTSEISRRSQDAFDKLAKNGWHVAKLQIDSNWLAASRNDVQVDSPNTIVLRSCVMKPEHLEVADEFADAVLSSLTADT